MPSPYTLTRAIANFERTLFTGKSKYDEFQYDKNTNALSASEKRGMDIFFGERGECFHCHGGFNFTDFSFKNNGLYEVYADSGRARITTLHSDVGKFKVPSLRNVELTTPTCTMVAWLHLKKWWSITAQEGNHISTKVF